jgi:hypothetical protein
MSDNLLYDLDVQYHSMDSDDWSEESYKLVYVLKTIKDFAMFLNTISKINLREFGFYLMKPGYSPTWEANIGAGIYSLSVVKKFGSKLIEDVMSMTAAKTYADADRVFCFALTAKNQFIMVKIWYENFKVEFNFPEELRARFRNASIRVKECSAGSTY